MNQLDFYVLSAREYNHRISFNCVVEFEDVLIDSLQATLISPSSLVEIMSSKRTSSIGKHAFIVGISFGDIVGVLRYAEKYLPSFEKIYAYTFDSILLDYELAKPTWKKKFSSYYRLARQIDHLFIPFQESVQAFAECYQIPVSRIPLAVDVLQHGSPPSYKVIDVNGYGRQDITCSRILSEAFNYRGSNRIYHHTDHTQMPAVNDVYAHRRMFWQLLRTSKIALAFDALAANNNQRFTFSFVGQRWFESAAAGCVIVGRKPNCPDMENLFFWEDATIDIPNDYGQFLPFIENMLNDTKRMEVIGLRNYAYMVGHHDWRHRINDILHMLALPIPAHLEKQVGELANLKSKLIANNNSL